MAEDLVTWLREQIAGDKHAARWVVDNNHANTSASWTEPSSGIVDTGDDLIATCDSALSRHIIRHDPAAVLAQCEAHERVLERHRRPRVDDSDESWMESNSCAGCGVTGDTDLSRTDDINDCPELRDMALAYQHRPGYRSEWKP